MRKFHTSTLNQFPSWHPHLFAEGDGGSDGSGGGSGGEGGGAGASTSSTPPAAAPAPALNLAEFAASLDKLNDNLGGKLDGLVSTVRDAEERNAPVPEPVDLEALSRPQLVAHIVSTMTETIQQVLQQHLAPLNEQITNLQTNVVSREASNEVERLRSANKDFADWKEDMISLARQPSYAALGIEDLYLLAKSKNPTKVGELQTKYAPPAPARRPSFGGLLPSGSGSSGNGAKPLSAKEAGVEAYREVQSRHSDVLPALELL